MAIKKINTDLQIEAGLLDGDGNSGTNNQILISTGTGVDWVNASTIIGGPYLPLTAGSSYPLTGDLYLKTTNDASVAREKIVWQTSQGTNRSFIRVGGSYANNALEFGTGNSILGMILHANAGLSIGTTVATTLPPASGLLVQGNVGIGTTSPSRKFEIHENTTNLTIGEKNGYTPSVYGPVVETNANAITLPGNLYLAGSQANVRNISSVLTLNGDNGIAFRYYDGSSGQEGMRLNNDGNVGIGKTSPSRKLDVEGRIRFSSNSNQAVNGFGEIYTSFSYGKGQIFIAPEAVTSPTNFHPNGGVTIGPANTSPPANGLIVSGNVGIGTTSPQSLLHIASTNPILTIQDTDTTASFNRTEFQSAGGALLFNTRQSNGTFVSTDYLQSKNATGAITHQWFISGTEKMRINSSGNVGIGTTNPFGAATNRTCLSVNGTSDVSLNVGTGGTQRAYLYSDGNFARLATIGAIPLQLGVNDLERMRITSSGNVGIGATAPLAKLQVGLSTSNSGSTLAMFGSANNGILSALSLVNTTGNSAIGYGTALDFHMNSGYSPTARIASIRETSNVVRAGLGFFTYEGGLTEKMRITNNGNVGIGTTSPSQKLTVVGNTYVSSGLLLLDNNQDIRWGDAGERITGHNTNGLVFTTNNFETMRINSQGRVGIGTTDPGSLLQVGGLDDGSNYDITLGWNAVDSEAVGTKRSAITFKTTQTGVNNEDIYKWDIAMIAAPATVSGEEFGSDLAFLRSTRSNTYTDAPSLILGRTGNATFAGKIHTPDGSASAPSYSFSGRTDTGMYARAHSSNDRLSFTTDGSERFYIDSNGATSNGNSYVGENNSFRNYAGDWGGTTGTANKGFYFLNTASGNTTKALEVTHDGNATFVGDITMTQSSGNNMLFINSSGGGNPVMYMQDSTRKWGQYVSNGDLFFKDETSTIESLKLDGGNGNAIFAGQISAPSSFNFTTNNGYIKVGSSWNTGVLNFLNGPTTYLQFDVPNGRIKNNLGSYLTASSNTGKFGSFDNQSISLVTNNTARLTIDTSGNATFAGDINLALSSSTQRALSSTGTNSMQIGDAGTQKLRFKNAAGYSLDISAAGNATFYGTITTSDNSNDNYIAATFSDSSYVRMHGYGLYMSRAHSYIRPTSDNSKTLYLGTSSERWSNIQINTPTATFAGDVTVAGTLTAQEFHTEFVSASIIYDSGSTKFGDTSDDNHDFTGSLNLSGSATIEGPGAALSIKNSTNGGGALIQFTDQTSDQQKGNITFYHTDGSSQGGGSSFHLTSTEGADSPILVVGDSSSSSRIVVKSAANNAEVDYGFYDDQNTGMVRTSADNVSLVAGGVRGVGVGNTAVSLKYSGNTKLATSNTGVTVTGDIDADDITIDNWGSVSASLASISDAGGVNGTGTANRIAIWSDSDTLTSNSGLTFTGGHILVNQGTEYRSKDTAGSVRTIMRVNSSNELEYGWSSNGAVKFMGGGSYTERMRIHTNGNVGIGTTNPLYKLTVEGSVAVQNAQNLWIRGGRIGYENAALNNAAYIYNIGASGSSKLNIADSLYVVEAGNVGIGTDSPDYKLEVNGKIATPAGAIVIEGQEIYANSEYSGNDGGVRINRFGYLGGQTKFRDTVIYNGKGSQILTVDGSTSRVGIGTTSPGKKLDVVSTSGTSIVQSLRNPSTSWNQYALTRYGTEGADFRYMDFGYFRGNNNEATRGLVVKSQANATLVTFLDAGNVGIGTTLPSTKLEVAGHVTINSPTGASQTSYGLRLRKTNSSSSVQAGGEILASPYPNNTNAANLIFKTADTVANLTQRMVIDGVGNVGIGDTSPTQISANTFSLSVNSSRTDLSGALISKANGTVKHQQYWDSSGYSFNLTANSGNFKFNGANVGIGTTNPSSKLEVYGSGSTVLDIQGSQGQLFSITDDLSGTLFAVSDISGVPIFEVEDTGKVSIDGDLKIKSANITYQENIDVDSAATETVATVNTSEYTGAFFDYTCVKGSNARIGTVMAISVGGSIEFTDNSTKDIGDTSGVTLTVDISGGNMRLRATTTTDDWIIKTLIRTL